MKHTIHLHDERWKKALRPYCKMVEAVVSVIPVTCHPRLVRGSRATSSDGANVPRPPIKSGVTSIVLTNDAEIQTLNKQYRGKNKPTNVLSFPNDDEPLGDVVLAYETIEHEAQQQGKSFKHHAAHLMVHGVLHLMGYDHENEKDAKKMEQKEIIILKKLGIKNPYL